MNPEKSSEREQREVFFIEECGIDVENMARLWLGAGDHHFAIVTVTAEFSKSSFMQRYRVLFGRMLSRLFLGQARVCRSHVHCGIRLPALQDVTLNTDPREAALGLRVRCGRTRRIRTP